MAEVAVVAVEIIAVVENVREMERKISRRRKEQKKTRGRQPGKGKQRIGRIEVDNKQ